MKRRRLVSALIVASVAAAACGGSGGGGSGGITSAEFAAEYCALYRPCCQAAGLPVGSQSACQLMFGFVPIQDAAAAEQCLDDWRQFAAAPGFCDLLAPEEQTASCQKAFPQNQEQPGTVAPGGKCDFDDDCAPTPKGEVSCRSPGDAPESFCQVAIAATEGAACAGTRDGNITYFSADASGVEVTVCDRADGVRCGEGVCVALEDVGSACTTGDACVDDAWCNGSTCAARVPAGSSCAESSSACDEQSYCEWADSTCKPRAAEGGACDTNEQCVTFYCNAGICEKPNLNGLALPFFCG
jgi:hypothetical protein